MRRQAHFLRVKVVAPCQHDAVQPIEDRREIGFPDQWRDEYGQRIRGQKTVEVPAVNVTMWRAALGRSPVIRVDTDEWTVFHGSHPFLEMVSAKSVDDTSGAFRDDVHTITHDRQSLPTGRFVAAARPHLQPEQFGDVPL
jgi:hypothetical protein